MKDLAVFVYSDRLLAYKFHDHHPFNQKRVFLTLDLLKHCGAIGEEQIVPPRMATEEELRLVHDQTYIEAVRKAGEGRLSEEEGESFGLGTEDTPMFPNMHEAASWIVGGTLTAADAVMGGAGIHAFHPGGGLHHGFPGKASGFCIYNDCAIAIKYVREKYGAKVLYVDTDAHHGDGVQWTFYDDPNVCTVSFHETGRYLFPGTGSVYERGVGKGYGYSFNIPLDAFTEDESWLYAYRKVIMEIADFFRPDVLITQNGADAHYFDPLTHLHASTAIYREIPKLAHEIAHRYCGGRWIALGGGGYDIWRVVPRAWSFLWLEMAGLPSPAGPLPKGWVEKWQKHAPVPLPAQWDDDRSAFPVIPRKKEIEEKNRQTVERILSMIGRQK